MRMCTQARREDLKAYVDGELRGAARWRLAAHVAVCRACSEEAAWLRRLGLDMRALDSLEPSPALRGRIMDALPALPAPALATRRRLGPAYALGLAAAALAAAAFGAWRLHAMPHRSAPHQVLPSVVVTCPPGRAGTPAPANTTRAPKPAERYTDPVSRAAEKLFESREAGAARKGAEAPATAHSQPPVADVETTDAVAAAAAVRAIAVQLDGAVAAVRFRRGARLPRLRVSLPEAALPTFTLQLHEWQAHGRLPSPRTRPTPRRDITPPTPARTGAPVVVFDVRFVPPARP